MSGRYPIFAGMRRKRRGDHPPCQSNSDEAHGRKKCDGTLSMRDSSGDEMEGQKQRPQRQHQHAVSPPALRFPSSTCTASSSETSSPNDDPESSKEVAKGRAQEPGSDAIQAQRKAGAKPPPLDKEENKSHREHSKALIRRVPSGNQDDMEVDMAEKVTKGQVVQKPPTTGLVLSTRRSSAKPDAQSFSCVLPNTTTTTKRRRVSQGVASTKPSHQSEVIDLLSSDDEEEEVDKKPKGKNSVPLNQAPLTKPDAFTTKNSLPLKQSRKEHAGAATKSLVTLEQQPITDDTASTTTSSAPDKQLPTICDAAPSVTRSVVVTLSALTNGSSPAKDPALEVAITSSANPKPEKKQNLTIPQVAWLKVVATSITPAIHDPLVRRKTLKDPPSVGSEQRSVTQEKEKSALTLPANKPRLAAAFENGVPPDSSKQSIHQTTVSEEDDDVDIEDDSCDQEIDAGTLEELTKSCWKCSVQLRVGDTGANADEEMCCYAMHTHPLFLVPICCVCSKEVAAVENEYSSSDRRDDPECCSGCGQHQDDVEFLFLCEAVDCKRGMCPTCVAQAHGGGAKGIEKMRRLASESDPWCCMLCVPPPPMTKLKEQIEKYAAEEVGPASKRTAEQAMLELDIVEAKKRECEEHDSPEFLQELRSKIRQEILNESEQFDPTSMDDEAERRLAKKVKDELADWQELMQKHEERLSDLAASLQEELESKFEVDLKKFYHSLGLIVQTTDDTVADELQWKKEADEVVSKRMAQRRADEAVDDSDDDSQVIPVDVEDLWLEFPDESTRGKVSRRMMERITLLEDERYKNHSVHVTQTLETTDIEKTLDEESASFGVISKVRRDDVVERSRRKRKAHDLSVPRGPPRVSRDRKLDGGANALPSKRAVVDPFRTNGDKEEPSSLALERIESLGVFEQSSLVLSDNCGSDETKRRTIAVAEPVAKLLKQHQREAIEFMFQRAFQDLSFLDADEARKAEENISGIILAHNMGLGKSLSAVALIHALLGHPSLNPPTSTRRPIHTVLLVVPVNTITNWENEFDKWTGSVNPRVDLFNLSTTDKSGRASVIRKWFQNGGVLLVTEQTFLRTVTSDSTAAACLQSPGPDAIFIDEAHTMLKNSTNKVFLALAAVKTKRRICLTGSPFQNDLTEYFRLVSYVKPGVFGDSERKFSNEFVDPIQKGLATDASQAEQELTEERFKIIEAKANPYIHRRDRTVLLRDLPSLQEVVLYVRKTKLQARLYAEFKKRKHSTEDDFENRNNFFLMYQALRPIHNHPGCLLSQRSTRHTVPVVPFKRPVATAAPVAPTKKESTNISLPMPNDEGVIELLSDSDEEPEQDIDPVFPLENTGDDTAAPGDQKEQWWMPVARRFGLENFRNIENGYKVVLLLHILIHASLLNEKVVVFSLSLPTLDFIEEVLKTEEWEKHVPSLKTSYSNQKSGGWRPGRDYLRLDGSSTAVERGDMVDEFNRDISDTKVFLVSSQAGGLGINLCSANRVVLFDSHFNPTITSQAIFRTYRYGQKKPVFVYRFLTEGSMEEKIYKKAVNKTNLGNRVIDSKSFLRQFSRKEVEHLSNDDEWIQCDNCEKWRMLPPWSSVDISELPDKWFCCMNDEDKQNSKCTDPERDGNWYAKNFAAASEDAVAVANEAPSDDRNVPSVTLSKADFDLLVKKDEILQKLLEVSASDQNSTVISNHKFHDYLIEKPNKSSAAVGIDSSKMASSTHELNPSNTDQTESSPKTPVVKAKASPKPQKPHKSCDAVGIDNAKTGTPSHDLNPSATDQKTKSSSATPVVKVKASPKTLADKDKKSKPASDKNNKQISSPFYMNTKKPRKPLPRSATRTSSRIAGGAQCPRVQVAARRRYSTSSSEESSDEMTSANRTSVHRSGTSSAVRTLKLGNESQDSSSSDCDAKPQANALSTNPVSKTNRKRSRELETKAAHQGSKNADGGPDNRKRSDLRESRRLDGSGVGDHPGNPNVTRGKEGVKRFFSKTLSFLVRRRPPPGSR